MWVFNTNKIDIIKIYGFLNKHDIIQLLYKVVSSEKFIYITFQVVTKYFIKF